MPDKFDFRVPALALLAVLAMGLLTGCDPGGGAAPRGVPEAAIEQNNLGTAYLGQQNWADAETAFLAALELRSDDPLLLNNIAVARNQQGRIDEAVEALQQALTADPDHLESHYNLGLIAKNQGDFESAAAHFEQVAAQDGDDLDTQYNLGVVLSRLGRDDEAETAFRKALARDATHVSTLYGLGRFLMQHGQVEEGEAMITRSQEIRASGMGDVVGTQYGEQGFYALGVDYPGGALAAPAGKGVTFERATRSTALKAPADRAWTLSRREGRAALWLADGATLQDQPLDSQASPVAGGAPGRIHAVAAGDVNSDGVLETAVLAGNDGELFLALAVGGQWTTGPFEPSVLAEAAISADLTFVDRDHDGDLDLFACWMGSSGTGCALAINDSSGQFAVAPSSDHGFSPPDGSAPVTVGFSDYDNDRDVDLILALAEGVRILSNVRDGTYKDVTSTAGLDGAAPGQGSVVVADLNKDGWMDVVVGGPAGIKPYWNTRGRYAAGTEISPDPGARFATGDLDNDGFVDLVASGPDGPRWHRNLGAGDWESSSPFDESGLDAAAIPVAVLDADSDGDADVAWLDGGNTPAWTKNLGNQSHRWIIIDSRGVGDNHFGIGSKIEILAGGLRQKYEVTSPAPLLVGLGEHQTVQSIRYLWPSGVLQDEIEQPIGQPIEITQLDRKGTSCPLLYAWRDGEWRFVTDFLGGSAVGYQLAPGVYSVPDTDETVKLDGGLTPAEDGSLRVRLNNQLEEVIWFDHVQLLVVDHPAGTEVFPDEKLMPGPPYPGFKLFASGDVRPAVAARGVESGIDHTATLAARDRRHVDDFRLLPFKGYAEPHTLELDLGDLPAGERVVMLLDGWIDYADSSANVAAAQAEHSLLPPRLLLPDGSGGWKWSERRMGFPAGLPKTMTTDLTGLLLPGDSRIRIETSMRIYWDRARVLVGGESTPLRVRRLDAKTADLRFGGFPRPLRLGATRVQGYDPQRVEMAGGWKAHAGRYTAFGEVAPLLSSLDDRFVTTRNGDEVELRFPAPEPVVAGWTRTYLIFADGFGKDMDPNSAGADIVGPTPYHGMPRYPYSPDEAQPSRIDQVDAESAGTRLVLPWPAGAPGATPQPLAAVVDAQEEDPG